MSSSPKKISITDLFRSVQRATIAAIRPPPPPPPVVDDEQSLSTDVSVFKKPVSIIVRPSDNDDRLRQQINKLCKSVKSWYFDLEQQLAIEFAPLKNRMSWHWTLEAVRRAWPTCVRFMTREKMLTRCGWTEPRHMAQTLLKSYGVTRQTIRDNLVQFSTLLAKNKYFGGDDFSMLDVAIAPLLWRLDYYGVKLTRVRLKIE